LLGIERKPKRLLSSPAIKYELHALSEPPADSLQHPRIRELNMRRQAIQERWQYQRKSQTEFCSLALITIGQVVEIRIKMHVLFTKMSGQGNAIFQTTGRRALYGFSKPVRTGFVSGIAT
jgi:hypothetical protein